MFVGAEVRLTVSFPVARSSLMQLARAGLLRRLSGDAYADVVRVGPVVGVSRLVKVRFADLVDHDDFAALPMRWEAAGAGGSLFPALDADITVAPDGKDSALLSVRGAYRPPLGAVGAGADRVLLHRVAEATVGTFARQVAAAILQETGDRHSESIALKNLKTDRAAQAAENDGQ